MKNTLFLIITLILISVFLTACMTERQAWLYSKDMQNKSQWPAFGEIVIEGPLTLEKGAKLVIPYPNQPYQNYPVPDDGQRIAATITDGIHTAGIVTAFIYGVHSAKGSTRKTTINNYGEGTNP